MKLIKKGILTSYQDLGRSGLRHLGVNPSGAMDKLTVRMLNIALQNDENEPILEMHFPAPEILFEKDSTIIIGGADFLPSIDNMPITNWKAILVKKGSILKFNKKKSGNRAYLAIKEDECKFLPYLANLIELVGDLPNKKTIRFLQGNEYKLLTKNSKRSLENQIFTVSLDANRMGFRMNAEPLEVETKKELVSSAVDFGTIQLLPTGQIIILMADHQTSGGYPRIGNVISADLPFLAQCGAKDTIILKKIEIKQAEDLLIEQEIELQKLRTSIRFFNEQKNN